MSPRNISMKEIPISFAMDPIVNGKDLTTLTDKLCEKRLVQIGARKVPSIMTKVHIRKNFKYQLIESRIVLSAL